MKTSPLRPPPHDPVARLTRACRAAKLAVTPQRAVIYRALARSYDHPSPEALYDRVKPELPQVSLGTIYKTLGLLVSLGLAKELAATGDKKRFDGRVDLHHHLICSSCRSITDYDDPALDRLAPPRIPGFTAESFSIHVHGLCRACTARPRA